MNLRIKFHRHESDILLFLYSNRELKNQPNFMTLTVGMEAIAVLRKAMLKA
jgi:hypothetical protein